MPRERFEALTRYLHLNDSEQIPGRDDPEYDPLYKIRPLIDTFQQNFSHSPVLEVVDLTEPFQH